MRHRMKHDGTATSTMKMCDVVRKKFCTAYQKISSFPPSPGIYCFNCFIYPRKFKNYEHHSSKKNTVIPWLDHGTQVIKSDCYNNAYTWAPWSSHGVTMKLMVSRFMNTAHQKSIVIPAQAGIYCTPARGPNYFICPCGVPLCQGFVVQTMDTHLRGYDECECGVGLCKLRH
jgi:hypothetical protein